MDLLKDLVSLSKIQSTFEAEEDDNWPKLISHADEFRVEMDKDEQVHLLDGEGKIRVSMPLVIWKQLCR